MSRSALEAALAYAAGGWPVFPCHEPGTRGCSCGRRDCSSPAKHPRTNKGLHSATTDHITISRWWRRWPNANVAVRTGATSGLVVLDIDPEHGGNESFSQILDGKAPVAATVVVNTGAGGRHLWFAHPGHPIRNSAGQLGPGLDVRGDGGYVIAPPSVHASGGCYTFATTSADLAPMPQWIEAGSALSTPPADRSTTWTSDPRPWALAALKGEAARVRAAAVGSRNATLNRAAFALGGIAAAGHLPKEDAAAALVQAGLAVGLTVRETHATVKSGLQAGARSPRSPVKDL